MNSSKAKHKLNSGQKKNHYIPAMEVVCFGINQPSAGKRSLHFLKIKLSSSHHQYIEHSYVMEFSPYLQKPYLQNLISLFLVCQ